VSSRVTARPLCAEISAESGESLQATASRIDHWLLVEYRGSWARRLLSGSGLSSEVKTHLREQLETLPRSRLLFIRRPRRASEPGLTCYVGRTPERGGAFRRFDLERYEDLLTVDAAAALAGEESSALDHPLLVVCTHGKRDRCCARYGRPLYDALREQVDADWLWQSSHVGGDRFAGNLVCFPQGLYFGRVGRGDAWPVVDEYLSDHLYLERYRGRCCYSFPVQAAEQAVRERAGVVGIDDLALISATRKGEETWRVSFRVLPTGDLHEVEVRVELGDLTYLTCTAATLQRPRRYLAASQRVEPLTAESPPAPGA
jgi:hypothetical protein